MTSAPQTQPPQGARCGEHPDREATTLCARCGGFACEGCSREHGGLSYCGACMDAASPLADPAIRLGAYLIDSVVLIAASLLLLGAAIVRSDALALATLVLGACAVLAVMAINLRWLHRYGQTIGKRILRLRIVAHDGSRMPLGRIVGKRILLPFALGLVPVLGGIFALVDPLFIFSRERRCIHDVFADSIVVRVAEPPRAYLPRDLKD